MSDDRGCCLGQHAEDCPNFNGPTWAELSNLQDENERLRKGWDRMRDAIHTLPQDALGPVAELCRNTEGRCFCGCHVGSRFDDWST